MLKIVATITDLGMAMNIGGDEVRTSVVINVPTSYIPERLKKHLAPDNKNRKYTTLSFSILDEEI